MRRALALARRGAGRTAPNPCVGAVVVRRGRIVGEGFHARYGAPHAEAVALRRAGPLARGARLLVTLEPCDHYGKTPPCTDAIVRAGIREVVCAMRDPHPIVNGRGMRRLRRAGVRVRVGLLAREADAVLVGIGTVLADDPRLSVRRDGVPSGRDPLKIIVDDRLRTPLTSRLVRAARRCRVLIATTARAPAARRRQFAARGVDVVVAPSHRGRVRLAALGRLLLRRGVQHLLIEGGGEVAASALAERFVDRVAWFVAPKIVGGTRAPTAVGGAGIARLPRAIRLLRPAVRWVGSDLLIEGDVAYP